MTVLEPYQQRAVAWLESRKRGIVQVPAGGGKTIIAAAALSRIAERFLPKCLKIGWLAPTIETRDQALKAIARFPNLERQNIKAQCATPGVDMSDRDILVVDECKHATAPTWFKIIQQCPRRIGLDATPFSGNADRDRALSLIFGDELFVVERDEVKRLVQAHVLMLDASDPVKDQIDAEIKRLVALRTRQMRFSRVSKGEIFSMAAWQACAPIGIAQNKRRNRAVVEIARRHIAESDQVLILVNQVEHGQLLSADIGPESRLVHAKVGARKRRQIMQSVRDGGCRCLIATSLADEGLDLPSLNVLILVSGGRSKVKAEQRTGRVLRSFGEKERGLIYDFLDTQHPTMANQSRERVALYQSLGYQVGKYQPERDKKKAE